MSFKPQDDTQEVLKHLWGGFVPPLTAEQVDMAIQLWQKIRSRKQRNAQSNSRENHHSA